jgi:HK97 family phage major capsid protein
MSAKIRNLQAKKAEHVKAARALTNAADAAGRDLTDEEQDQFKDLTEKIHALDASIEREQMLASAEAGLSAAGGVEIPAAATITVHDRQADDPKRGYSTFGEFARSVANATRTGVRDNRLAMAAHIAQQQDRLAAAPTTFGNEAAGADGGFAIPPEFSNEIWRLSLGEDNMLPQTQNTEIGGNSMIFPKDESTPWGSTGVQVYWQAEASQATQSKPALGIDTMVLHKLMALVPVTNELIDDGFAIGSYLEQVTPERIAWKTNEAILFGDGVGKPLGALVGNAAVVQAKDSGQATNTLSTTNISNMVTRLLAGNLKNAFWLGTPDILPYLEALTVGNFPIYLPNMTAAEAPYGMLKGRPLMLSEHASAFSSKGDLNLLNLKGYRTISKAGGLQTATSMHLYFDADATAFKFSFRLNGKPILSAPVTPPKSAVTRSHFVTLAAR